MSFLDDIIDVGSSVLDFGKSAVGFLGGSGIGSMLARTALTGFALSQITKSINKSNEVNTTPTPDPGVRLQVDPDPNNQIPVIYGQAVVGGIVTDAYLTENNLTMYYCLTLCEKTGNTNLGSGAASEFTFKEIYWDGNRVVFDAADGVTITGFVDSTGTFCATMGGQVKVYCYGGGSSSQVSPEGFTVTNPTAAYNVFPNWTTNHLMSDLVFAIVRVDYSAEKNVKGLPTMKFKIANSMSQAGDVLYDYMTNTRYGAGIDPTEIYAS
jgi:hypothetical protein